MNKISDDCGHQNIAVTGSERLSKRNSAEKSKASGKSHRNIPQGQGGGVLPRDACRLLENLELQGACALLDPTDLDSVILHRTRAGISVGAGRFATRHAEHLVRLDLARWEGENSRSRRLVLTDAGRARLRRAEAGAEEVAFLHQHHETASATVLGETGPARVRVDMEESPLDWLRRRRGRDGEPMIDEASYQAGERLRVDITLAGLLPGVTARWDATPRSAGPSSPSDATDRMVAARQRIRHAFDAVGADFADLLMDLCGFMKGLELIERERRWPPRSAKVVVRLALARLAEHYGIEAEARGPAASRGIRTWQAVVIEGGRV